jgi:uncharacterized membrane protein
MMLSTHANDEAGMVGKIVVVWLVVVALLGIVAIDAASILFTRFRLSDVAADAASDAANEYAKSHSSVQACDAALATLQHEDPKVHVPQGGCKVNVSTGEVTLTVRKEAPTMLAGRISVTKDLARVVQKETNGPTTL